MSRFLTKLAVTALVLAPVTLLSPGAADAQTQPAAVDEASGPVSFANVASIRMDGAGQHGGSLITETQRSPLTPGQSKLGTDRVAVPKDDGERSTFGGHYEIDLGHYDSAASSPYPAGIASRDHNVVAALQQTGVPTASAETNYAFRDNWQPVDRPIDESEIVLQDAKTSVDCTAPGKATSSATMAKLWIRGSNGTLAPMSVPSGTDTLAVKNLRMGPPGEVTDADRATTTSDVAISRVSTFDQLIRQDGWRGGDVTAVSGWRIQVTTHPRDASGGALPDVHTTVVLGGVSCSIPKNFVARSGNNGAGASVSQAPLPNQVPAGYLGVAEPETGGSRLPLGFGLVGIGLLLAAVAVLAGRRRRSSE